MTGIEALHDAITHAIGWTPRSRSARNRNPGLTMKCAGRQGDYDLDGYMVYPSIYDGSMALLLELDLLISGNNNIGITPDSKLRALCDVYAERRPIYRPQAFSWHVAEWLNRALGLQFNESTPLRDIARANSQEENAPCHQNAHHAGIDPARTITN